MQAVEVKAPEIPVQNPEKAKKKHAYSKEWYANNKDRHLAFLKQKVRCETCDCQLSYVQQWRHKKTEKHLRNLRKIEDAKREEENKDTDKKLKEMIDRFLTKEEKLDLIMKLIRK